VSVTSSQQSRASERSTQIRSARSLLRHELASGSREQARARAAGELRAPADETAGMTVLALLTACRSCGQTRARGLLRRAGVAEQLTISELSSLQRCKLLAQLERAGS